MDGRKRNDGQRVRDVNWQRLEALLGHHFLYVIRGVQSAQALLDGDLPRGSGAYEDGVSALGDSRARLL